MIAAALGVLAPKGSGLLDVEFEDLSEISVQVRLGDALLKTLVQLTQWACT
jgi:hypothetical protein